MGKKFTNILKVFLLILIIVIVFYLSHYFHLHVIVQENLSYLIEKGGIWGPLVFVAFYTISSFVPVPASVLSALSGIFWGPYLGTFFTVIGASLSTVLPFLVARKLGRASFERMINQSKFMTVCDNQISKNGLFSVLIVRLIPIFPWEMSNFALGLCGIRFRDYFLASIIGTIPGSYVYNVLGASFGKQLSVFSIIVAVLLAVIAISVSIYLRRKNKNEA